ncbi:hypothetical protein HG536_0D02040 [Torulaspora globosa]|uniref:RNA helicase n=1 Tax=Torulaspora globosa TaxID=48254 RepID=A0A7G3ZGP6_9SACH|nr:uncharacterized protein HG536_0D02040 [Torulaspora globosa]QLL32682.1 hypothetical protein HG536_0D02040 [Torulaspora globosa]
MSPGSLDSAMKPVSANDKMSAEILQERQQRLAKWKQKKAQFDKEKKDQSVEQITNNDSSEDKAAARRQKLEAWKRKKRERDHERLKEKASSEESKKPAEPNAKRRKSKKDKIAFDLSDEETASSSVELYRPNQDSLNDRRTQSSEEKASSNNADLADPLDEYMQRIASLSAAESSSRHMADEFLEDKDDPLETIGEENDLEEQDDDGVRYTRIAKLKSKKKVKEVEFAREDLEPFRKNFYRQSEELTSMSESEAQELRMALGNIKIKGSGCPLPVARWSQLGLTSDVMNFIMRDLKYELPTPIQAQAIPAIMSGRDVIGISKTGSGKTISYLLPLLRQIKAQRPLSADETGPLGLILAPTRELAQQIYEEVLLFTKGDEAINAVCCTGGSELKQQINSLKRGAEVVVATPGRFIDLLTLNMGRLLTTKRITFVVLDEADRLFDLGFEPQITQIMGTVRRDKQCVLFSATFPNKLKNFAMRVLNSPISITINSQNLVNENVTQRFQIFASDDEKYQALVRILDERMKNEAKLDPSSGVEEQTDDKAIIFVSSQQICDFLGRKLENEGHIIQSIHAGKPYQQRINNLQKFKTMRNSILLCTEVLSRGLNVPEVSLVIIYNAAKTFAQYVHTTGRTARGTHSGDAITLLLNNEISSAFILRKALREQELLLHDSSSVQELQRMSEKFEMGIKSGKYKVSQGFGGKGLDSLDLKRKSKESEERQRYGDEEDANEIQRKSANTTDGGRSGEVDSLIQVPKLQYSISQISNPDGVISFAAEVNVNDLPQLVRWEATKNDTLMFIKHETGCSITNKGKFYPEGKAPRSETDEPKLYLLIESAQEKDIRLSIELLEGKVKEGVRKAGIQSIKDTKY